MQITRIKGKNFLSFKNLDLSFENYNGIVKILGENLDTSGSNGAGKSTIFDMVLWGLFGQTIRKTTEESLVSTFAGKETEVILSIKKGNDEISIKRTKRPTSLWFHVNGELKNKENAIETQVAIDELLGCDYKSFIHSIVFGQHLPSNFIDSSAEEKRKVIKNCLNLNSLFEKRESTKELKSKYTAELKVFQTLIESLSKDRDKLKDQIPKKQYKYVELPSLESILEAEKQLREIDKKVSETNTEIKQTKLIIKRTEEALSKGIFQESKECPVCKSEYNKSQTQSDLESLEQDKRMGATQLEVLADDLINLDNWKKKVIPEYSSTLWNKYNEKNKLILEQNKVLEKYKEIEDKIEEYNKKVNELTGLIEIMKFWELAFSEKGLIRYIVRNILEYFNLRSNEYLSLLTDSQFKIEFNDELNEKITNNNSEVKFNSLSGGEKKKLNLAIMLAIQDLGSKISKTNSNLIFFDEVCDNIDSQGIEAVYNLLKLIQSENKDKVILLITHNQKLNEMLGECQEIKVIKEKGISRIDGEV